MSVRGAIAWRAHVKVLQRDEFFDSVTAYSQVRRSGS
jgi:hypothetical protein